MEVWWMDLFIQIFLKILLELNCITMMLMRKFQSDLAVYHDDFGDYSTNEPTMDGTASLIYLLAAKENEATDQNDLKQNEMISHGGIIRGDTT